MFPTCPPEIVLLYAIVRYTPLSRPFFHGNVKVGFVRMGGRVERQAGARVGRRELDPREAGECVGREFAVRRL